MTLDIGLRSPVRAADAPGAAEIPGVEGADAEASDLGESAVGESDAGESGAGSLAPDTDAVGTTPGADTDAVFPQSVASGGPTPTGVILWTRVAPDAYDPGTPLTLAVAADPEFESVVADATVPAHEFGQHHDHTVRVDLDGALDPDRHYWYRFGYDDVASRTGRCRTLPAPDASPERVRLGVVSCQHYQNGYFGAYHHLAREDVDFLLHLGDYIYESADRRYREPNAPRFPRRELSLPSGHEVAWTLADFRYLYRTYRTDRFLRAAHERHTVIRGWDDHAITNNRYWDYDADAPVGPDHPRGDDPHFMRQLTAAGIRSWWEYTPARIGYDADADHLHDALRLWRHVRFGDLVSFLLTDQRLFRGAPPGAGSDARLPSWLPGLGGDPADPSRTMLGAEQRDWLIERLRRDDATWTAWGNEVLSMPLQAGVEPAVVRPKVDAWDGYEHERNRVFAALAGTENAVTLTGDMHTTLAGYQELPDGSRVGVEFMTPSVTSVTIAEAIQADTGLRRRIARPLFARLARVMNPHFEYFDSHHWGYSTVEFTPDACTFTTYSVDKTTDSASADRRRLARFRVPAGTTEIHRQTD